MAAQLERHPQHLLVRITGDLRLWNHSDREEEVLGTTFAGLEEHPQQVVLSLRGVSFVDSCGIAALVRILVRCVRQGTGLQVVIPTGIAGEALRRIHIFDAWPELKEEPAASRVLGA